MWVTCRVMQFLPLLLLSGSTRLLFGTRLVFSATVREHRWSSIRLDWKRDSKSKKDSSSPCNMFQIAKFKHDHSWLWPTIVWCSKQTECIKLNAGFCTQSLKLPIITLASFTLILRLKNWNMLHCNLYSPFCICLSCFISSVTYCIN